jgi:protein-tyrosine-phosphatase
MRRCPTRVVSTVLIVCHANTARSMMAHVLLERLLAERGVATVRVRSAGVARYARDGMIASLDARLALRERGVRLEEEAFVSTALAEHPELLREAALVLTMTTHQKDIVAAFPEAVGRPLFTLRELAGEAGDIEDPAAQGQDVFRACCDEIVRCLDKSVDRLLTLAGHVAGRAG